MKKFSKIIACLSVLVMCISTLDFSGGISAYSAYTGHGFTDAEISASPVKPNIQIGYEYFLGTAWEPGHGTAYINITLSGENVDNNYCNTGLRISYPEVKEYYTSGLPYYVSLEIVDVKPGKAIESLSYNVEYNDDNSIFLTTEGDSNAGKTGVMYTLVCRTPDYIRGGEKFEINLDIEDGKSYFTNYENDETGKLMQDYLFTKGIKNGYVGCGYMTTTSAYTDYYYTTTSTTSKTTPKPTTTTTTATYAPTTTWYTTTSATKAPTQTITTTTTTTDAPFSTWYTTTVTYTSDWPDTYTTWYTTTSTTRTTNIDIIGSSPIRTYTSSSGTIVTTEKPVQTTTSTTTNTTAPVVTGTGYENWTTFEDTIVSIEDNKVTFAERGKTAVMNNGSNMDMIKDAGVGSKVSVEAIVSPSGSILNIINIEVLENPDVPTGDANGDGETSLADAVLIMQSLANPEEFSVSDECAAAADIVNKGDGITPMDALAIQMLNINLLKPEDLPTTSEKLQSLVK